MLGDALRIMQIILDLIVLHVQVVEVETLFKKLTAFLKTSLPCSLQHLNITYNMSSFQEFVTLTSCS